MKEKIKQFIRFIKKYLGETILVIGTGLFVRNIFNFSYYSRREYYYYPSDVLMGISIGIMLIVAGILIIKKQTK